MNINTLSLEQCAGQRIMAGFNGPLFNDDLKYLIDSVKVGGIILFKQNIESPRQVTDLCFSAREYAKSCGQPPLFIAIDQEGGTVARLPRPFTQFPGNSAVASEADAVAFAKITASELTDIGVNMNYAPVLDVAPKSMESVMAKRSYGHDPEWVSRLGAAVIANLQAKKIMAVAKHFPGIGRTTLDSHLDRPFFSARMEELEDYDLIPFKAAIANNVSGIMLSHIVYDNIDPQWPASLSVTIAKDLLRKKMGYNGLILTDDLDMGAIKKYYEMEDIVSQAVAAQIDIILICHQSPDIESAHQLFLNQLKQENHKEDFTLSLNRIAEAKKNYLL